MHNLTLNQILKISHSLGVDLFRAVMSLKLKDKKLPDEFYRNYYNTSKDVPKDILFLESIGLMKLFTPNYYQVTDAGIDEFKRHFKKLAIYKNKKESNDINFLRHRINFYCDFYRYDYGIESFEHIKYSYLNYYSKKQYVSHTTKDVIVQFLPELKKHLKLNQL